MSNYIHAHHEIQMKIIEHNSEIQQTSFQDLTIVQISSSNKNTILSAIKEIRFKELKESITTITQKMSNLNKDTATIFKKQDNMEILEMKSIIQDLKSTTKIKNSLAELDSRSEMGEESVYLEMCRKKLPILKIRKKELKK